MEPKAAKPYFCTMEDQTKGRKELYKFHQPPGKPIPANATRNPSEDGPPTDEELSRAVKRSGNGKLDGASMMRAEDIKEWLGAAEREEKVEKEGKKGYKGAGNTWRLLVKLVKHIWETGEIPRQLLRMIVVLIPKGSSGDFRGIGLLEVI